MMMAGGLPDFNAFLKETPLRSTLREYVIRFVAGFALHFGRMSASQVGRVVKSDARHRGSVTRFLSGLDAAVMSGLLSGLGAKLLALEANKTGKWLFILDQTYCGQQGKKTENTYSTAHRGRRQKHAPKDKRKKKKKQAQKSCHCFVFALLITPSGYRVPFFKSYYTEAYCRKYQKTYRKQTELAGELIRTLSVPDEADVVVLGDTAFDAEPVHSACASRRFSSIVSMNGERVLSGPKPRPKVASLVDGFSPKQFVPVRLVPGQGAYVPQRRVAACRIGPKVKSRTFYVHQERLPVQALGEVRVVFSRQTRPQQGQPVEAQKILITNDRKLSVRQIVELYDLRWQIELFFKELKSTLGFHQYRFEKFACVQRWAELCLTAFLYLEWYRATRLRRNLTDQQRRWWTAQRSHGLCQAIRQQVDRHDLKTIECYLESKRGLRKLKQLVRRACPPEFRIPT